MGKVPIRLKEITYVLSPFEQSVMSGLTKDLGHKAAHHVANVSTSSSGGGAGFASCLLACQEQVWRSLPVGVKWRR